MGKHLKLIEAVKNELLDSKDNLLMYVEDYIHSISEGEDPEISFADIYAASSEVDAISDLLGDLLSHNFDMWDEVIDASFRFVKANRTIENAIDIFRREVVTNE